MLAATQLAGDRRRRTADPHGDGPHPEPRLTQVGDEDAFFLGQVTGADRADFQAVQWLDEPDDLPVAVGLVAARPVRSRRARDTYLPPVCRHRPTLRPQLH